jgi:predicted DNA-binding protein with PD1-like motif
MQHKLLHEAGGQRTFVVVLETGEEIVASLQQFAER